MKRKLELDQKLNEKQWSEFEKDMIAGLNIWMGCLKR
jgi:hypothetical protein